MATMEHGRWERGLECVVQGDFVVSSLVSGPVYKNRGVGLIRKMKFSILDVLNVCVLIC